MSPQEHYAKVFGNPAQAAVYHLPSDGLPALVAAAESRGLATRLVELAGVRDKQGFLEAVARALAFPDWFGHNWDALEECLGDLSWLEGRGWLVILRHCDEFEAAQPEDFSTALTVFSAAAAAWRKEGLGFWALVDIQVDGLAWLPSLP